jgi:hypothetical protein
MEKKVLKHIFNDFSEECSIIMKIVKILVLKTQQMIKLPHGISYVYKIFPFCIMFSVASLSLLYCLPCVAAECCLQSNCNWTYFVGSN